MSQRGRVIVDLGAGVPDPDASDTAPSLACLTAELDAPYEPPTATDPAALPDQCEVATHRYPLLRVHRDELSIWALFLFWVRLLLWRRRER